MPHQVFLSYSQQDKKTAQRLYQDLRAAGIEVWIDTQNLMPGTPDWLMAIDGALEEASCFVVLLSPDSLDSEWVQHEISRALNPPKAWKRSSVPTIPVIIRELKDGLPPILHRIQYIDLRFYDEAKVLKLKQAIWEVTTVKLTPVCWLTWKKIIAAMVLTIAALALAFLFGTRLVSSVPNPPTVSWVSMRYTGDRFDPRLINLGTVSEDGIPIRAEHPLRLHDILISASEDAPGYVVQAEVNIAGSGTHIGNSDAIEIRKGLLELGDIQVTDQFAYEDSSTEWRVQDNWETLQVRLVIYYEGEVVSSTSINLELNPAGTSWLRETPDVDFASITYSIDDGSPLVLDLQADGRPSLHIAPGQRLSVRDVWFRSDLSSQATIQLEAYLGEFNIETYRASSPELIRQGVHRMSAFVPIEWVVEPDQPHLVISLVRNDGAVIDRLIVNLNQTGSAGLVNKTNTLSWPFNQVTYVDFETPLELDEWEGTLGSSIAQSADYAFSGIYSLAVTTTSSADENVKARWQHTFTGETLIGQVYWPDQEDVQLVWAQACVYVCVPLDLAVDRWNTFVMDFSEMRFEDNPLNSIEFGSVWLQVEIEGIDENNPYTFYVDGIQLYTTEP